MLYYLTDNCDSGSSKFKKIGNKCYTLGLTQLNLDDAQQYCLAYGGKLAEPDLTEDDIRALHDGFVTQFADELTTSIIYLGLIEGMPLRVASAIKNFTLN